MALVFWIDPPNLLCPWLSFSARAKKKSQGAKEVFVNLRATVYSNADKLTFGTGTRLEVFPSKY